MTIINESFGTALEEDISNFEQKYGISLPDQYKEFLMQHNGGVPSLGEFGVPNWGDSVPNTFYGIGIGGVYDIERVMRSFDDAIPNDMLPIGDDPGGNQICLGIKNGRFGRIFFWDHEAWDDDDNPNQPIELASSLTEFFNICKT